MSTLSESDTTIRTELLSNFIANSLKNEPSYYYLIDCEHQLPIRILSIDKDEILVQTYRGNFVIDTPGFIKSLKNGEIASNLYPASMRAPVKSKPKPKQYQITAEDDIVIKPKHHYLFVRPQDGSLYVGYCINVIGGNCAVIVPERTPLTGWTNDPQLLKVDANGSISHVVKDLGYSETAKLIKQLYDTTRNVAKKNTLAELRGYGHVIVDHLSIIDNVIKIYFRVMMGSTVDMSSTMYRAPLTKFLKATKLEL